MKLQHSIRQTLINDMKEGTFIIDRACGRGKTTDIFNFICQHYNEGILYCVDSLSELNKMKMQLEIALVQTGKISDKDIMTITSEPNSDARGVLYDYHTHPENLFTKKILLITHVRFFTSMLNYFMIYHPHAPAPVHIFNGDMQALLTRDDLRQWIFFDETPMWIHPFCTIPRSLLGAFSEKQNGVWRCKSVGDIQETYKKFIKGTREDPFRHDTCLDDLKKQCVLSMLPIRYEAWMSQSKSADISIYFRPRDLAIDGIKTHILFYEGAADLLLSGSPFIPVPTKGKKYNALINFQQIPFLTTRGQGFDGGKYSASLEHVIGIIIENLKVGKKTLVCVWKTKDSSKDDIDGANVSLFRNYVIAHLIARGAYFGYNIEGYFDVIYYGENKCKSCNDYCDYSAIILFGKWFMPDSKCSEHNLNWGTNITPRRLHLWFYVQLISRIGLRRHDGRTYDVYMTDDFSDDFIRQLKDYFNKDRLPEDRKKSIKEDLDDRLQGVHLYKMMKDRIKILCATHPELRNHVLDPDKDTTLELYVSDEELKEILSYEGRHFTRAKKDFSRALRHVNVRLNSAPNLCP